MSSIDDIRSVLSQANLQSGEVMATLVESQRHIEALANMVATVTQGSDNELVQRALATFGLARTQLSEVVGVIHDGTDHLSNYQQTL
ncbi:hypothetical protein A8924_7406 [Saccharopolyspora erythraea NRRL 2338]|uniref:Uncharacterized protein n=2 Tax=Saccharopolyspora erythraea TaxID=1836 RepID=A4FQ51_SACEN|nr:hypothetical protein [Saccharopolyspora erythraea]EQD84392.1 hypothetical protein N599_20290 [Saccharopolyspora erythraea D]PFG99822.1 hypothetical protein A8924_7377 [Saccharopolyspora erythraea NRRL 2338]PFG99848.1 hypothetical protein A8924_7406 [Saccharopolyspora erythraea NRRL 2338]QRK89693.1 hypothetical protein JQX30_35120 [Saccharopolyspora erythraea]CAM06176.1 hypothetical protein SACE_7015 [Saccharopolyspora erythraea NRRL 2338]